MLLNHYCFLLCQSLLIGWSSLLEEHQYDTAAIYAGIDDLLKGMSSNVTVTVDNIFNDNFEIASRCRNHNIGELFI